jgi:hypothetical protein
MFGIKKDKRNIGDFYKELEDATNGKAYGIQLAELLFSLFCGYFQDRTDCIACYGYGGREIFFRATMPEDEAAFYRKDFGQRTDRERIKGNKAVRIWTENGALGGMWVLEMPDGMNEDVEDSFREMVSLVQPVFAACLFAEEWKEERMRDCVTGLLGNAAFEETLRRLMEQGVDGYLITARRPALYGRPYTEDGMNRSVRALAKACEKSAVPYIYRISEDAVALICPDGQERAYAVAQELADADSTDIFVTELAELDQDKVYSAIQQNFDRTGEDREAFGLHYPEPKLPIYRDDPKGGRDGE